jgi:hypothetical protein
MMNGKRGESKGIFDVSRQVLKHDKLGLNLVDRFGIKFNFKTIVFCLNKITKVCSKDFGPGSFDSDHSRYFLLCFLKSSNRFRTI